MTKREFLDALKQELSFLPADEAEDAIEYYDEYISESEDEQAAIDELGSPKRVADDLKKDYFEKNPENKSLPVINYNNTSSSKRPTWLIVLIVVLAIAFGVPVLNLAGGIIRALFPIAALILIAVLLIKALKKRDNSYIPASPVQTCSDIRSLDIRLGGGMFVIQTGDAFNISGKNFKSEITNSVWHISGSSSSIGQNHEAPTDTSTVVITIPSGFTAERARIRLGAGNLLIKDLSAYSMTIEVSLGNIEAQRLYSTDMEIRCGVGRITAAGSMHGNVKIQCGMGDTSLKLTNKTEEYNITTKVALGRISLNSHDVREGYVQSANASYNMDIKCGMGNVIVNFGEVL